MSKNKAAVALGKKGGKAKSAAKALSSKANGAKGGRPRKTEELFKILCESAALEDAMTNPLPDVRLAQHQTELCPPRANQPTK